MHWLDVVEYYAYIGLGSGFGFWLVGEIVGRRFTFGEGIFIGAVWPWAWFVFLKDAGKSLAKRLKS